MILSPLLCSGVLTEYFNLVGKTPEFKDVLIMRHKGELMKGALAFSILVEISSYPHGFFPGRERINFSISPVMYSEKSD
jgi:hypothetical protein